MGVNVASLEDQIAEWRAVVAQSGTISASEVDELEEHLREQILELGSAGLADDEAFLVAVKRMGAVDRVAREFAVEHSDRLWRQLMVPGPDGDRSETGWTDAIAHAAVAAAIVVVLVVFAGIDEMDVWALRTIPLVVVGVLGAFLTRRRGLPLTTMWPAGAVLLATAIVANVPPWSGSVAAEALVVVHIPALAWFVLADPYTAGDVGSPERRMDFIRFTGEWFIYFVLFGLGGGVLTALTALVLEPTGVDPESIVPWVLMAGAAGAVIIAASLVEAKQQVIENMAPVLTAVFTPLFAVMLTVAAVLYAVTGLGDTFDRELIGIFDALLVVVLGLVLYGMSARDGTEAPGWTDRIQLVAVGAALALDVVVLTAMVSRIGEFGFTANRVAAIGLNLVLAVNLAGAAWRSVRFLRGIGTFHDTVRWQTSYFPVYVGWVALVIVVLPLVFR